MSIRTRLDSWLSAFGNVGLGFGRTNFRHISDTRLDDSTLESVFFSDPFAHRIVSSVPQEAMRHRYRFTTDDPSISDGVLAYGDRVRLTSRTLEGWIWGRLYGGAALLLGADDGRDSDEPLDLDNIRSLRFISAVDKRELSPLRWFMDAMSPNFGEPELYQLTRAAGVSVDTRVVHASRIVRFDGAMAHRRRRAANNGWSESELQRVYTTLQQFNGAYAACGTLLQDASQGVFKIKDLFGMMGADAKDALKTRMEVMDAARSSANAVMLDADTEDFTRTEVTFAGIPDVVDRFTILLAGAAEIPVTILMGQAPAGLNATGDSDVRNWYDRIRSAQESYLKPKLQRLLRVILRAKDGPTGGVEPPDWNVSFAPLYQPSPAEEADMRLKVSQMDVAYITAGVVTPEEIALSRFGRDGWSIETQVSLEDREAMMAQSATPSAPQPTQAHTHVAPDSSMQITPHGAVGTPTIIPKAVAAVQPLETQPLPETKPPTATVKNGFHP